MLFRSWTLENGELPAVNFKNSFSCFNEKGDAIRQKRKSKKEFPRACISLFELSVCPEIKFKSLIDLSWKQRRALLWSKYVQALSNIVELENELYRKIDRRSGKGVVVIRISPTALVAYDEKEAVGLLIFEQIGIAKVN